MGAFDAQAYGQTRIAASVAMRRAGGAEYSVEAVRAAA